MVQAALDQIIFGNPEKGQPAVRPIIIREIQDEGGHVVAGGQVKASVARGPLEVGEKRARAGVPLFGGDQAALLFGPDVERQAFEGVLISDYRPGLFGFFGDGVEADGDADIWVGFFPTLRGGPVVAFVNGVDHRPERVVHVDAVEDLLAVLVHLESDGLAVVACGGQHDEERLFARLARAPERIVQEAVGLDVMLVEYNGMGVQSVRHRRVARHDFENGVGFLVGNGAAEGFGAGGELGTHLDHRFGDVEGERGLVARACHGVDFGAEFAIGKKQFVGETRAEGGLAVLFWDLDEGAAVAARAISALPSEHRPDDHGEFPIFEGEGFARFGVDGGLGMFQDFGKEVFGIQRGGAVEVERIFLVLPGARQVVYVPLAG